MKLTATGIGHLGPGMHGDGEGLWLRGASLVATLVGIPLSTATSARMGFGPYPAVSLAEAREKAQAVRKLPANGIDPLDHREAERQAAETYICAQSWLAQSQAPAMAQLPQPHPRAVGATAVGADRQFAHIGIALVSYRPGASGGSIGPQTRRGVCCGFCVKF
jgi:hypothetical protein